MYLSCLLVEDGMRHLFDINLTVSCLFSSYTLACVSAPSSTRHLRLWNRRPHRASSLISYLSYQSVLDDTPISQLLPLLQRDGTNSPEFESMLNLHINRIHQYRNIQKTMTYRN